LETDMPPQALTLDDIVAHEGLFHPVDHVIVGFDDDRRAAEAAAALRDAGIAASDIVQYTSAQWHPALQRRIEESPRSAGFGYEITLMRRYEELARAGAGWLAVHLSDDTAAPRVTEVAERHGARTAVRYHRLASEDLI
jgi:hypothetical protein